MKGDRDRDRSGGKALKANQRARDKLEHTSKAHMQPTSCPLCGSRVHPGGKPGGKQTYKIVQTRTESLGLNGAPGAGEWGPGEVGQGH